MAKDTWKKAAVGISGAALLIMIAGGLIWVGSTYERVLDSQHDIRQELRDFRGEVKASQWTKADDEIHMERYSYANGLKTVEHEKITP